MPFEQRSARARSNTQAASARIKGHSIQIGFRTMCHADGLSRREGQDQPSRFSDAPTLARTRSLSAHPPALAACTDTLATARSPSTAATTQRLHTFATVLHRARASPSTCTGEYVRLSDGCEVSGRTQRLLEGSSHELKLGCILHGFHADGGINSAHQCWRILHRQPVARWPRQTQVQISFLRMPNASLPAVKTLRVFAHEVPRPERVPLGGKPPEVAVWHHTRCLSKGQQS